MTRSVDDWKNAIRKRFVERIKERLWGVYFEARDLLFQNKPLTLLHISLAEVRYGLSGWVCDMLDKSVYFAYSWFIGISQILLFSQESATVDAFMRYDFSTHDFWTGVADCHNRTAWGFGVALSTKQGNARASMNGKGNSTDSHASFFINAWLRRFYKAQKKSTYA